MKQKKTLLLLHCSKKRFDHKHTDLTRDLTGDLVANKLSYYSKTDLVGDNTGDLAGDLLAKKLCCVAKTDFTR
jgi:hypothetical protein